MKTSSLRKFAWVFFALVVTSGTVFGQRGRGFNQQSGSCLNRISDLTEAQQTQIQKMDEAHWAAMDDLRSQRRSTSDAIEKSEINTTMLKTVEAHRNAVKAVLTEDQQVQYESLHLNAGGPNQNLGAGRGSNPGHRGQGNFSARSNSNCGKGQANNRGNRGRNQNSNRGTCIYN